MRYVRAVSAAGCVVAMLVGPASVRPAAGQGPTMGAARHLGSWEEGPRLPRSVQVESGETTRSSARLTIGSVLLAAGAGAAYAAYYRCEVGGTDGERYTGKYEQGGCVLEPRPAWGHDVFAKHVPNYQIVGAGAGAATLGLLLTTVWSGAEVKQNQSGGVEVAMSIWSR